MSYELIVPGRPIPWARARSKGGHRFTPARQAGHKDAVGWAAKAAGVRPLSGPVGVALEFRYPRPKRSSANGYPRGDLDNLTKLILDALNGLAWGDDDQVVALAAAKRYAEEPATIVRVDPLPLEEL